MASSDPKTAEDKPAENKEEQKPAAVGEDDEFEDFPADGWFALKALYSPLRSLEKKLLPLKFPSPSKRHGGERSQSSDACRSCSLIGNWQTDWEQEETEAASGSGTTKHLWEESWDDDDTSDDFSTQLKCAIPSPVHFRGL